MLEHPLGSRTRQLATEPCVEVNPANTFWVRGDNKGTEPTNMLVGMGGRCGHAHNWLLTGVPSQAYVNMALFENFTYAGIDATAEEA